MGKSVKGETTKAAKSGKNVKSVKSRPCRDSIIVNDDNIRIYFPSDPGSGDGSGDCSDDGSDDCSGDGSGDADSRILAVAEEIKCFDTSQVTNMTNLFFNSTEF